MRISDWSSDVCSSDLALTTANPNIAICPGSRCCSARAALQAESSAIGVDLSTTAGAPFPETGGPCASARPASAATGGHRRDYPPKALPRSHRRGPAQAALLVGGETMITVDADPARGRGGSRPGHLGELPP